MAMDPGAASQQSSAAGGTGHKKKRFHGNAAAAIAARRAGHAPGGTAGANAVDDDEAAFISSSRDASEEDNDEASGYSDSASSMRRPTSTQRLASPLPTSARDKALVDSRDAHRRPAVPSADKTPLSSSPSRNAVGVTQVSAPTSTLPSDGLNDPQTNAMLSEATAALVNSSSTNLDQTTVAGPQSAIPRHATASLARQESSAGSEGSDASREKHPLSLGALPTPSNFSHVQLSATTPKAPAEAQREAAPLSTIREAKRKGSTSNAGAHGSETDGEATDGAAASPYDGDVEFAARSPVVPQSTTIPAGQHAGPAVFPAAAVFATTAASPGIGSTAHAAAHSSYPPPSANFSTAPVDVPSRKYISSTQAANLTKSDGARDTEKPVPMASPAEIRSFIHRAIYEPDSQRPYKINAPPDGGKNPARPVRIYADGVYDLFHYAHALQLRQAKLCFPSVHLVVGVVSSDLCAEHKNRPAMTSQERYAAVRTCKWVDEVVEEAPWVITQELLDKLAIDYVAHDELPYAGAGSSAEMADVYQFVKDQGRFLPTQRTDGVSTSELLARIVEQYRNHDYDKKLAKIGHEELAFN